MTSLQYEKTCRGPLAAVAEEYAWGSTLQNAASSVIDNGTGTEKYSNSGTDGGIIGPVANIGRVGMNAPANNSSRELANASYYGIVGLSGRANNGVIPIGEDYTGQQGDGILTIGGEADFMDTEIPLQSKSYSLTSGKGRVSSFNGLTTPTSPRNNNHSLRGIWYIVL